MSEKFKEALRLFFNTLLSADDDFQRVSMRETKVEDNDYYRYGGGGSAGGTGPSVTPRGRE